MKKLAKLTPRSKFLATTAAAISGLLIFNILPSFVGAQPAQNPPMGNVGPVFNSLTINDGVGDTLGIDSAGSIFSPSGTITLGNDTVINGTAILNATGGANVDLDVSGRIRTGGLDGAGGVWVEADPAKSLFMGENTGKIGFYNAGWRMLVDTLGNVGIGTSAPTGKLHVTATAGQPTLVVGRAAGQPNIKAAADNYLIMDSNGQYASINHYENDNVILANGGGNVGVGTTNPTTKLSVNGGITGTSVGRFYSVYTNSTINPSTAINGSSWTTTSSPYMGATGNVTFTWAIVDVGGGAYDKYWYFSGLNCLAGDQYVYPYFLSFGTDGSLTSVYPWLNGSWFWTAEPDWVAPLDRSIGTDAARPALRCFSPD